MLLWLIEAAGVDKNLAEAARRTSTDDNSLMQKSGAIRKVVPWAVVCETMFGTDG